MYEIYCKLRDEKGLKDAEIAKKAGVTRSTFSDWKNGRSTPKHEKLIKISEVLDVSIEYLTTGKDSRFTEEMADIDAKLLLLSKRLKEYSIKLSGLSEEDQNDIMKMIDRFSK